VAGKFAVAASDLFAPGSFCLQHRQPFGVGHDSHVGYEFLQHERRAAWPLQFYSTVTPAFISRAKFAAHEGNDFLQRS
jgi:hypothetical protein